MPCLFLQFGNYFFEYIVQPGHPEGYPWIGTLSAFVLVLFTMWLVSLVSRKKIYWRA